ncbi:MAG: 5-formyltetrahydrofolate cyclo-ligase [Gammaproteobacteria bacterium]|nr:5-formyltetrahydrofolate cyclo-ligase [Gammaproteobacteria bacterium]
MSSSSDNKTGQPDEAEIRSYASPPCYQHELDPNYLGIAEADEKELPSVDSSWTVVRAWRTTTRSRLIAFRSSLAVDECKRRAISVARNLQEAAILTGHQRIGFCWPMAGEIDLRPLMTDLVEGGIDAALPVITEKDRPLEFWRWHPDSDLDYSGPMGIPVPTTRQLVKVTALLIPMIGFDNQGHRLGHGGGYFDRTLAEMHPRPKAIGVGHEECRLPSIFPQAHDIPMDLIVTDAGIYKTDESVAGILPVTD